MEKILDYKEPKELFLNPNKRVFKKFDSYLKFYAKNKNQIKSVKVTPPKLGGSGFGFISVETK